MSEFQWLLALHVTGAFLFLGGGVMAAILGIAARRATEPDEVAVLLRLSQVALVVIASGGLLTLVLGLWLVHHGGFAYGQTWIVFSLVLFPAALAAASLAGRRERRARLLAERLAGEPDLSRNELEERLRDPISRALSWGSGTAILAILALMIWKPGA